MDIDWQRRKFLKLSGLVCTSLFLPACDNSEKAQIKEKSAPMITAHPENIEVIEGDRATFSVTANGSSLEYQWLSNGLNISGATADSYLTDALELADNSTTYTVRVYNKVGTITSSEATLTVNPLTITADSSVFTVDNTNLMVDRV